MTAGPPARASAPAASAWWRAPPPGAIATIGARTRGPADASHAATCSSGLRAEEELGRAAVGFHREVARGGEVALGYRPPIAIAVSLGRESAAPAPAGAWDRPASGRAPAGEAPGSAGCRAGRAGGCTASPLSSVGHAEQRSARAPMPSTRCTCGLWLSSGTYSRLVSTVMRAPGWACRIARRSGVVRRMSPMELKRTARTFGEVEAWARGRSVQR